MRVGVFYAIREKGTHRYLPYAFKKTHVEPTAGVLPRLFESRRGAVAALTAWRKGKAYLANPERFDVIKYETISSRDVEMEIVALNLEDGS